MRNIWNDLKFALRQLRRSPGFAVTAILTLALGIGANTAIFSLLDQALLRTLPVHDPSALVVLRDSAVNTFWRGSVSTNGGDNEDYFSYTEYAALRDHGRGFASLAATRLQQGVLTRDGRSEFVNLEIVSGNYFQTLGTTPALGRLLGPFDDAHINGDQVGVVSYSYWQEHLGSNPGVVGSTVDINGHPFQIIGVSAPHFKSAVWGQDTDIFIPMSMVEVALPGGGDPLHNHGYKWLNIFGRLQPGYTPALAAAINAPLWHSIRASDLSLLGTQSANFSLGYVSSQLIVRPGARGFAFNRTGFEKPLLAVMAMALLVLLIASVNVASLLMVRSAGRAREFALRVALGASSARIVGQLLLEGVLIGIGGGFVGMLLAPFTLHLVIHRLTDLGGQSPYTSEIDDRVLLFNFGVAVLVSLAFSLIPALQARRPNLTSTLRESTGTGSGGLLYLRRIIVCVQIGLSVVLLVGAGLFIRTMQQLRAVPLGFDTSHLISFDIDPQLSGYSATETPVVQQRVLDGLRTLPGVESVAASTVQELVANGDFTHADLTGYQYPPDSMFQVEYTTVTPDYLKTLKVPLLAGRNLSETDTADHPLVTIVNRAFVKHFCNGSNPSCIGRFIKLGSQSKPGRPPIEIVGVYADYRDRGIQEDIPATVYFPFKQDSVANNPQLAHLFYYVRSGMTPTESIAQIRLVMHQMAPTVAMGPIFTMDKEVDQDLQNQSMIELLAISFGLLATLLAGVGLYGVLAYSTAQRTREIGIRMALGSTRLAVSRLILTDVLTLAAIGVAIAIPTAYGLSVLIRSQLFGVSAADPAILSVVVLLIAFVALLAALIPARRAATISPTEALRIE